MLITSIPLSGAPIGCFFITVSMLEMLPEIVSATREDLGVLKGKLQPEVDKGVTFFKEKSTEVRSRLNKEVQIPSWLPAHVKTYLEGLRSKESIADRIILLKKKLQDSHQIIKKQDLARLSQFRDASTNAFVDFPLLIQGKIFNLSTVEYLNSQDPLSVDDISHPDNQYFEDFAEVYCEICDEYNLNDSLSMSLGG